MCGILGIACYDQSNPNYKIAADLRSLCRRLLVFSRRRGSDASGLCVVSGDTASLFKMNIPSDDLVKKHEYSNVVGSITHKKRFRAMIGHTRMKTKGDQIFNVNNHPIKANKVVGVHNGVISNDDALFGQYGGKVERAGRVDSEIIFRLIDYHTSKGKSLTQAVEDTHRELFGGYACAFIHRDWPDYLTVFTNSMAVPIFIFDKPKVMVFASTEDIVRSAMQVDSLIGNPSKADEIIEVSRGGVRINLRNGKILGFKLDHSRANKWPNQMEAFVC